MINIMINCFKRFFYFFVLFLCVSSMHSMDSICKPSEIIYQVIAFVSTPYSYIKNKIFDVRRKLHQYDFTINDSLLREIKKIEKQKNFSEESLLTIKNYIERGANSNLIIDLKRGYQTTVLLRAIEYNKQNIVKSLLDHKANPNFYVDEFRRITPLSCAIEINNSEIVKDLLEYGANPNLSIMNSDWKETLLILAVKQQKLDMVKSLLEKGAHIDGYDGYEQTALSTAIRKGNKETVEALLKYNADPNLQIQHCGKKANGKKITPLLLAIKKQNLDMVKFLLKKVLILIIMMR